jgi:hypothetical protein
MLMKPLTHTRGKSLMHTPERLQTHTPEKHPMRTLEKLQTHTPGKHPTHTRARQPPIISMMKPLPSSSARRHKRT